MTTILLCTTALTISPKTESEPLYHASPTLNGLEIVIQARWILYRFVKVVVHFSGYLVLLSVFTPGFNSARLDVSINFLL